MKSECNILSLDYRDMPDLKAALGGLTPGDACEVTFKLTVKANGDNGLEATIDEVEYETPGEDSGTDSAEPTSEEPVMVAIAARAKRAKSGQAPKVAQESDEEDET